CSSFKNTDNSICIIILNQNDFKENTVIKIKEQTIEVSLKKHSIMTIVIN
ncbi:MAG: glycoside hydrolase family 30 beta sandwich domain-containing protein, partial [Clostridiaceae bacterium]